MKPELKYVELKSGYSDDGPAWIGMVEFSKSGKSIYFNGHSFIGNGHGVSIDIETREVYWITGIKKNGENRHWAGSGKIMIDKDVVEEYLKIIDSPKLDKTKFEIVEIEKTDKRRFVAIENATIESAEILNKYSDLTNLSISELKKVIESLKSRESRTNPNNGRKYITVKILEAEELLEKIQNKI